MREPSGDHAAARTPWNDATPEKRTDTTPTSVVWPVSALTTNARCVALDRTRICVPSGDQATVSIQASAGSVSQYGFCHASMPVTRLDPVPSIPMTYSPTPAFSAFAIASRWPSGDHDGPLITPAAKRNGSAPSAPTTYSWRPIWLILLRTIQLARPHTEPRPGAGHRATMRAGGAAPGSRRRAPAKCPCRRPPSCQTHLRGVDGALIERTNCMRTLFIIRRVTGIIKIVVSPGRHGMVTARLAIPQVVLAIVVRVAQNAGYRVPLNFYFAIACVSPGIALAIGHGNWCGDNYNGAAE